MKKNKNRRMPDLINCGPPAPYLIVHKKLITHLGPIPALIFANLVHKDELAASEANIRFEEYGGWFVYPHKQQCEDLGLTEYAIRQAKQMLLEVNLIFIKREGMPMKEWYKINRREE